MKTTNKTKTSEELRRYAQRGGVNKREEFKKGFRALERIEDNKYLAFQEYMHLMNLLDYANEEPWAWGAKEDSILSLEDKVAKIEQFTAELKTQLKKIKKNEKEVKI